MGSDRSYGATPRWFELTQDWVLFCRMVLTVVSLRIVFCVVKIP